MILTNCANINNYSDKDFRDISNYEDKIKNYLHNVVKNPDSIKILNITKPRKTFIQNMTPSALWNPFFPVYGVCVKYIGTNNYGAKLSSYENFYIRNGNVLYHSITIKKYEPCK